VEERISADYTRTVYEVKDNELSVFASAIPYYSQSPCSNGDSEPDWGEVDRTEPLAREWSRLPKPIRGRLCYAPGAE